MTGVYSVLSRTPALTPRMIEVKNIAVDDVSKKEEVSLTSWCHRPSGACVFFAAVACSWKIVFTFALAAVSGYPSGLW
jgi:hypothetical protein